MKSMAATEIILIIGTLVAVGVVLVQLRGVFYSQELLAKEEVVTSFAKDLEDIIDKAAFSTGDVDFVYHPLIKKYYVNVSSALKGANYVSQVLIYDKISGKSTSFYKSFEVIDNNFEDCDRILVIKKESKILLTCRCHENGEACKDDLICCSVYCNETSKRCDIPPVCPESLKCPGTPMTGGPGDNAWIDINGVTCCPLNNIGDSSGPICSSKRCCPTHKPVWCKRPIQSDPRCMSESEYKTDCKICKNSFILVVVANNYADMNAYKARVNREMQIVRDESPFRECPDCLDIKILDVNCQANYNSYNSIINCVHSNYGTNYNLIYAANADNWCNGYSLVGFPFTICGNGLPTEIKDICAIHEIGHNAGDLCDEYGYNYWTSEGCPASGWSEYNLVASGGCTSFNCGGSQSCCGTKLKPSDSSDRTVDIMGGGGGMKSGCSGAYVTPAHFRDYNYNRFKTSISGYCG